MKNIQIIDGAKNSVFEVYSVDEETFDSIFGNNKDIVFINDMKEYLDFEKLEVQKFWAKLYEIRADKKNVKGIHGTLHLEHSICDSRYYPDRKEEKVIKDKLIMD